MKCTRPKEHRSRWACLALALWMLGSAAPVYAQEPPTNGANGENALEPRISPRAAMLGYLTAARSGDYAKAAEFMDLRRVAKKEEGPRLARQLKFVLDEQLWVDVDALSNEPVGNQRDDLPRRDQVGIIETETGPVRIVLERSTRDNEWRISGPTVAAIEPLYEEFGLGPLGELLPEPMFFQLGELALWQWIALLVWVVIAYAVSALVTNIVLRIGHRFARGTTSELDDRFLDSAAGPMTAVILVALFSLGTLPLGLSVPARTFIHRSSGVLIIGALAWLAIRAVDVVAAGLERKIRDRTDTTVLTVIPVGRRIAKVFLAVIAVLAALQNLGFNVISVIAGLGVVGIAVALAAQKTFENFFGTISILIDQPIRRGDFCRFGDLMGTIEDIGLRSTRIRTLDRTLITVPNSEFSNLKLENFAARDRIRFRTVLGLRYETRADQLRHVLIALQDLLLSHPRIDRGSRRVRFIGFGAYSLDIEIESQVTTRDWAEFLAIREDLLLRIIEIVEASGTSFAFPSQTLYVRPDDGLDDLRSEAAVEEVQRLREARQLPLPDPTPERVAKLEHTLTYPPPGSASTR